MEGMSHFFSLFCFISQNDEKRKRRQEKTKRKNVLCLYACKKRTNSPDSNHFHLSHFPTNPWSKFQVRSRSARPSPFWDTFWRRHRPYTRPRRAARSYQKRRGHWPSRRWMGIRSRRDTVNRRRRPPRWRRCQERRGVATRWRKRRNGRWGRRGNRRNRCPADMCRERKEWACRKRRRIGNRLGMAGVGSGG